MLIAIISIAITLDFIPTHGHFLFRKLFLSSVGMLVAAWLLWDAWRQPTGELVYSQGQWLLQENGQDITGTLHLHLDLQTYMLARFEQGQPQVVQLSKKKWKRALQWMFKSGAKSHRTSLWVHLEPWQGQTSSQSNVDWTSLRRAVYAPQSTGASDEKLAF
jgi:hypothetical protein